MIRKFSILIHNTQKIAHLERFSINAEGYKPYLTSCPVTV